MMGVIATWDQGKLGTKPYRRRIRRSAMLFKPRRKCVLKPLRQRGKLISKKKPLNRGDHMAEAKGVQVSLNFKQLHEQLCPECKRKLEQMLGKELVAKMT